jgi:3-oxoacyl-(acyl-carrier-protein) synthase
LSNAGVFITSLGIISPVGQGLNDNLDAIRKATRGIKPLRLFPTSHTPPLPVGEIGSFSFASDIPRTHALALVAAEEAMKHAAGAPDAVVIGVTTGGISFTEELLKRGELDSKQYQYHSTGSVAEYIARHVGCTGPVLTVSTACSSGTVALKIALEMLRCGMAKQVLAGGADALCRLTYYGFHALQLVDEAGARPFDRYRRGMSVGEGAAMLVLTAAENPPDKAMAELLGVGLSCDAYHPAAPHPEGAGALRAMEEALSDACLSPVDIDYMQLHGTGTLDNDLAEAKAIRALFGKRPIPPLSSIKGSLGHSLGAAGAMGAAVSVLSIVHDMIPANTGFHDYDPELKLTPVRVPTTADVKVALVNSFGFGGNNAVLALGHPKRPKRAVTTVY